jgi:hypothetical protein
MRPVPGTVAVAVQPASRWRRAAARPRRRLVECRRGSTARASRGRTERRRRVRRAMLAASRAAAPGRQRDRGTRPPRGRDPVHPPEDDRVVLDAQDRRAPARARLAEQSADRCVPADRAGRSGSSRTRHVGAHRDDARDRDRCCSPPDSANGSAIGEVGDPEAVQDVVDAAIHLGRAARRGFSRPNASSSRTVASRPTAGWPASRTRSRPARAASGGGGRPVDAVDADATLELGPDDPRDEPAAARVSVDLPAPVRPATPTRSPAAARRSTSARAGVERPG